MSGSQEIIQNFESSSSTSTTTIHQLRSFTLIRIFSFLDAKSLLSASRVCKAWSEHIGSSPRTMSKFKLNLRKCYYPSECDRYEWKHVNVEMNFTRSHLCHSTNKSFMKLLNQFNFSETRSLTFTKDRGIEFPLSCWYYRRCRCWKI